MNIKCYFKALNYKVQEHFPKLPLPFTINILCYTNITTGNLFAKINETYFVQKAICDKLHLHHKYIYIIMQQEIFSILFNSFYPTIIPNLHDNNNFNSMKMHHEILITQSILWATFYIHIYNIFRLLTLMVDWSFVEMSFLLNG